MDKPYNTELSSSMNLALGMVAKMERTDREPSPEVPGILTSRRTLVITCEGIINPPEYRERILDLSDRALDEAVPLLLDTFEQVRVTDEQQSISEVCEWLKIQREQIASGTHKWSSYLGEEFNEDTTDEELEQKPPAQYYVNLILALHVHQRDDEPADKVHQPIVMGCVILKHALGDDQEVQTVDSIWVMPEQK